MEVSRNGMEGSAVAVVLLPLVAVVVAVVVSPEDDADDSGQRAVTLNDCNLAVVSPVIGRRLNSLT